MKDAICDGVDKESDTGPGKPYWRIPLGSTGEMSAGDGVEVTGTAGNDAAGGGGTTGVEVITFVPFNVSVGVGAGMLSLDLEKMIALSEAPAAADAAATMARVDFDMMIWKRKRSRACSECCAG